MTNSDMRHVSDGHDAQAETTERLAAAMHDGVNRVAERARDIEHTLRERGAVLGEEARKHEERARTAVADQLQRASRYLRGQPLSAGVALAAAAGIVIGGLLLLRR
ncbi:MAG TPA: hypothetical protein VKA43_15385 [Gammaproteobacteria bacterium]|nr:hypothetical protein [Gammaproteobacteria bacterium]